MDKGACYEDMTFYLLLSIAGKCSPWYIEDYYRTCRKRFPVLFMYNLIDYRYEQVTTNEISMNDFHNKETSGVTLIDSVN